MFDYRRGFWRGRLAAIDADRLKLDPEHTTQRLAAASAGRDGTWLAGFRQGVETLDRSRLAWNVKAQALQPPSPHDSVDVRWRRSDNAWKRTMVKFDNRFVAVLVGLAAVGVVVGTVLAPFHRVYFAMWAVDAAWAYLGCVWLPRHAVRAELAEQRSLADPDFAGLRKTGWRGELWSLLVGANAVGGAVVLILLAGSAT